MGKGFDYIEYDREVYDRELKDFLPQARRDRPRNPSGKASENRIPYWS